MTKIKFSFRFFISIVCMTVYYSGQGLHAQTKLLNIEPENPPGYVPNSQAPPQKPSATAAPAVPTATPQAVVPAQASPMPVSPTAAPIDDGMPLEKPPEASNFQSSGDISTSVPDLAPNPNHPNISAPANAPNYPASTKPTPPANKNQIVDVVVRPPERNIFALVTTSMGNFKIKLYPQYAPKTVKNFVDLATGQKEFVEIATSKKSTRPFYNGQIIFKVVRDFVIQMGCPFGDGRGGPGYEISDEFTPYLHHNKAGMVAMANHGPQSAGSQFFITLNPQPEFDDKYPIFGEVVSGMNVVVKISKVKTGPTSRPLKRIVIQKIEIEGVKVP